MAEGHYRHHLRRLRDRVARASEAASDNLGRLGLAGFSPPSGGYYLWCPLPDGFDDMDLTRRAAAAGIFMAPSSIFTLDRVGYRPAIRVNVAYADDPRFLAFMRGELA